MFKKLAVAMVLILAAVTSANATVYYAPPSSVTVRPDPYAQAGAAVGNILGSAIQNGQQRKQEKKLRETIEEIRKQTKTYVEDIAESYKQAIVDGNNPNDILNNVEYYVYSKLMCNPIRNRNGYGLETIYWTKEFPEYGGIKRAEEFLIDSRTGLIRSLVRIYDWNGTLVVEEAGTRNFAVSSNR